ncbi:hypothetical protein [Fontibacter flavus]|uniref:Beta-lactamase n=1 Tax=Fontibacter flavus TaxID=654838 RepID=A0ABV6FXG9_9BACT
MKKSRLNGTRRFLSIGLVTMMALFTNGAFAKTANNSNDQLREEKIGDIVPDLENIKPSPRVTIINKYGDVIAEFYGEKELLKSKFQETFQKSKFILSYDDHHFYFMD